LKGEGGRERKGCRSVSEGESRLMTRDVREGALLTEKEEE
jgi:hypothetical protein